MASQATENPLSTFTGLDGQPLQDGYVYFGEPDLNPVEYPVSVYWDEALTIPATQPIRTNAGYLWRNGTPSRVWVNGNYSTLVQDSTGRQVYYASDWSAASSENITFIQAGTGAVLRTAQSKMRDIVSVFDFGAVGDGSMDDTTAIQNALNTGKAVMIPGGGYSYKITSALEPVSGQLVMGDGLPTVRQYTTDLPVFDIDGCTDVVIDGIVCYAIGTMTSYTNGCGVRSRNGCERIAVRNCVIKNHRGFGILFWDTDDSEASGNVLIDSPVTNSDNHTQAAGDICLLGEAKNNNVFGNRCVSGNGIGVNIQSFGSVTTCSNNTVTGNVIRDCKMYGVNVYGLEPTDIVYNNVISGNSIRDVSGAVAHSPLGYVFGNGVYCVSAQETTITGNSIKNTHSGAVTFVNQLAPAAIGATECGRIVITGNSIDNEKMWGITVRDPASGGLAIGFSEVSGNTITNTTNDGIQVFQSGRVNICNNTVDTVGSNGIFVQNTVTQRPCVSVTGNTIRNVGSSGIRATYLQQSSIANNTIHTTAVHGISVDFYTDLALTGNVVRDHTTYGMIISDGSRYTLAGNVVHGTGSSAVGYYILDRGQISRANEVTGCTNAWLGTYRPYQSAAPTTGTWEQGDIVWNAGPSVGAPIGFACEASGTPGTWVYFGVCY